MTDSSPLENLPIGSIRALFKRSVQSPLLASASSIMNGQLRNNSIPKIQIKYKFGELGSSRSKLNSPHGFCLGIEEEIVVADTKNHRIQIFEKTGDLKYQFGLAGKADGFLWFPRKVAVIRSSGNIVVGDRGHHRSRMQIFTREGFFLKKIPIHYIEILAGLAISSENNIVAIDSVEPAVFILDENGDLLRFFKCSQYVFEPSELAIRGDEYYICDFKGHCVAVFSGNGTFLRRLGCQNLTNYPNGIDISEAGDVLVGDCHGNHFHVVAFSMDGSFLFQFECPFVKVSRCCGLKITSEGYVITVAKNNHHLLVTEELYIRR